MTISRRARPVFGLAVLLLGVFGVSQGSVRAETANISQSYDAATAIRPGSIVSLDASLKNFVVLSNQKTAVKVIGVVVKSSDSLIAVNSGKNRVQVANSGKVAVLVSTLNGPIAVGDQIALSPFDGIGARAAAGQRVVGWAQGDFSDSSANGANQQVTDVAGKQHTVRVGYVPVSIAVGLASGTTGDDGLNGLQRFVRSLTGRKISTGRIILSLVIAVATLVALVVLIYSAIYGSIISIGRNPLASKAIIRALWYVVWMATITVIVAMTLLYLLLR